MLDSPWPEPGLLTAPRYRYFEGHVRGREHARLALAQTNRHW
jgi:hypothetical protein